MAATVCSATVHGPSRLPPPLPTLTQVAVAARAATGLHSPHPFCPESAQRAALVYTFPPCASTYVPYAHGLPDDEHSEQCSGKDAASAAALAAATSSTGAAPEWCRAKEGADM